MSNFIVICDESNNSSDDLLRNELHVDITLKLDPEFLIKAREEYIEEKYPTYKKIKEQGTKKQIATVRALLK